MPRIPFTIRRDGRYYFRRRARWQNGNEVNVVLPLATCSAQAARNRSAGLAAHFDRVKNAVGAYFNLDRTLEPEMLKGLFETELSVCLAKLIAEFHDPANQPDALVAQFRTYASAYDIAQRPGDVGELTDSHRAKLAEAGHDEMAIEWVACDLDRHCHKDVLDDEVMAFMAEGMGVEPTPAVVGRMKSIHLQARAEAHRLAAHYMDEDVQAAFDQEEALLAKRRANGEPLSFVAPQLPAVALAAAAQPMADGGPATTEEQACVFRQYHPERFSSVIPEIIELARLAGHWTRNLAQYERVLRTFAWITGDKPLGDYNHSDVAKFKNGLLRMPRLYKPARDFGRPFDEVVTTLKVTSENARSFNTIKRDLSYMSTAYEILAENRWEPRVPATKALDFSKAKLAKHTKVSEKSDRPVWTVPHMECLFSAPIWTGGGGHLRRFDRAAGSEVFHDAAYWLPLLLYYTHATVNEIAGLRVDEVVVDAPVPYLTIKDNDIRAEDGVDGGLKNSSRGRSIPLHAEILRLNFAGYARAIQAEGHAALFPELYLNTARVGGHQFRNIAWCHMVSWIGAHLDVPTNDITGKSADMHSIRALGSSFYAQAKAPDLMRADVMGHARTGTNALHYSKRRRSHGEDQVLGEYRAFMGDHTDVATSGLHPRAVHLLPLRHRSRTGRPRN